MIVVAFVAGVMFGCIVFGFFQAWLEDIAEREKEKDDTL